MVDMYREKKTNMAEERCWSNRKQALQAHTESVNVVFYMEPIELYTYIYIL